VPKKQAKTPRVMGTVKDSSQAVTLYYHRRSQRLDYGHFSVPTVKPKGLSDGEERGPLPVATYLIDTMRFNMTFKKEWFNLHAPLEDGTGFYGYGDKVLWRLMRNRRCLFGLHQGEVSSGCVTISDPEEWVKVRDYVSSGRLIYTGRDGGNQQFCGYLVVQDD